MNAIAGSDTPLVDLRLRDDALAEALGRAASLRKIPVDRTVVLDAEKLANGTFSPLTGFLGSKDTACVSKHGRLTDGRPWAIPIVLQVDRATAETIVVGHDVLLWNEEEDAPCAILGVSEVFPLDLLRIAEDVWRTTDRKHPGVDRWLSRGTHALAGSIQLVRRSESLIPVRFDIEPRETRAEFARRGWKTITGFQTRNLGHRAHERLQKIALEITDGLLIHPLIGWKKSGDMLPEVVLEGYELLVDRYYPKEHVVLAGLTTAMRYAGPREAVFHALIRRNFGCTHFIVGRDHAGVGGYYGKYDAHKAFDAYAPGELGITPLRLHGPCWCNACAEIVTEKTCPHGESAWVDISGTEVRAMIARGESPPAFYMRPEIADFLISRARTGAVFF